MEQERINLIIVDDSELVRSGVSGIIEPPLTIVGSFGTAKEALEFFSTNPSVDIAIIDLRLPDTTGFSLVETLTKTKPFLKFLILTSVAESHSIDRALKSGAHGYLLKDLDAQYLNQALLDIYQGRSVIDPKITDKLLNIFYPKINLKQMPLLPHVIQTLSEHEKLLLKRLSQGKINKEIGAELGLSEKTIKNQLTALFQKLGVSRRVEAATLFAKYYSNG